MKEYGTRLHRLLEILSWIILLICFLAAVYGMFTLPDTIAAHFNIAGGADRYASPANLLFVPIMMAGSLLIISLPLRR